MYPKIGIRPTIDGRQGGVRESLEEKTMALAHAVADLISNNLRNGDGTPVECVIADSTIGRVAETAARRPHNWCRGRGYGAYPPCPPRWPR